MRLGELRNVCPSTNSIEIRSDPPAVFLLKVPALQPDERPDADGWVTIRVEKLVFPPWCCSCGKPTLTRQPFRAHHMTGFAFILIPVCEECQQAYRQNYRRAFWWPIAIVQKLVAVTGFCAGSIPALADIDPKSFPILPILCAIGLPLLSFPIVWFALRRRALKAVPPPVQLRRYIRNRRVSFRFRRPEYTAEVVSMLEAAARSG